MYLNPVARLMKTQKTTSFHANSFPPQIWAIYEKNHPDLKEWLLVYLLKGGKTMKTHYMTMLSKVYTIYYTHINTTQHDYIILFMQ